VSSEHVSSLETDDCINCGKPIEATGISKEIQESYGIGRVIESHSFASYDWIHTDTGQGKCDNESGRYAAGKKLPPQNRSQHA
jgi:hypothetical protein